MMRPFFVVFDVIEVPSGDWAIGGTDEYLDANLSLVSSDFEGKRVSLLLRGGERVETNVLGLAVHTALSEKRNIYIRIPRPDATPDSLRGAIVSVDLDDPS